MKAGWVREEQPAPTSLSVPFLSSRVSSCQDKTSPPYDEVDLSIRMVGAGQDTERRDSELLVGSDISNLESVRHCVKSASNSCLRLRLDTAVAVASAVVFLSETLGQPSTGRHLCSKLIF